MKLLRKLLPQLHLPVPIGPSAPSIHGAGWLVEDGSVSHAGPFFWLMCPLPQGGECIADCAAVCFQRLLQIPLGQQGSPRPGGHAPRAHDWLAQTWPRDSGAVHAVD